MPPSPPSTRQRQNCSGWLMADVAVIAVIVLTLVLLVAQYRRGDPEDEGDDWQW